ncbi:MAG TPA: TolC family protein, partial [Thermoanaerobaculia bacterium]|nr:TolC family protein [Thermoanaerobaculia bacterium]
MFHRDVPPFPRARSRRAAVLAGILCPVLAGPAAADSLRALTLEEALALALQRNPSLQAQAQSVVSSQAGQVTAGLRPNPQFQNDTTSATVGLYQEIEIGGKRSARLESASSATAISQTDLADARRLLVRDVRQAFIGALLAKANVALARENLSSFRDVVEVHRIRLEQGALSGADFLKIELQRLQYETDFRDAAAALETAKAALRELVGRNLPEEFEVEGELRATLSDKSLEELRQLALTNRPDLRSAQTGVQKAAADARLAKANSYPDPTIGASFLHTGNEIGGPSWFQPFYPKGETSNAMGLGVSFPIPLFNRNQGEIARARSEERRAEFLAEAARDRILQEVESAYAAFESSASRVRLYEETYLSLAKQARDSAEFAFRKGATSILDFLDAERTYRATQLSYRQELASYQSSLAHLEAAA